MSVECENLDAFLAGDLSPVDSNRFEAHLHSCDACREAINEQRWIDALLGSPERLVLEPVSSALTGPVRDSILSRRRQSRLVACGLAAAAVLVIAVGWTTVLNGPARDPVAHQVAETAVRDNESSPRPSVQGRGSEKPPRSVFVGGPDVIAVPVASRHPNVTIVRVYATYPSSMASPAASDESDADYFNGG
ncbi:MAG TPA: zf-HC2 domain-containing protein [Pirellulales bacterium]|nr:zf-HC2 domain-containing protein [Pirellulales bacterium]